MSKIEKVISISLDDKTKTGLDKIEQTFKDVDNSIKKAEGTSVNLRKELKQLQNDLLAGKFTGEEFKKAEQRAGELKDTIADLSSKIKVLGSDTRTLDGLIGAAEGIAGGFALAQGAAALFGNENKDLEETLLKVQSTMAILNGITAITNQLQKESASSVLFSTLAQKAYNLVLDESTGKLNIFKLALAGTGIGLIILAIGALVANWDKLSEAIGGSTQKMKDLNSVSEATANSMESVYTDLFKVKTAFNEASRGAITKKEALKIYNETLGDTLGKAKTLEEAEKIYKEKTPDYVQASFLRAQALELINAAAKQAAENLTEKGQVQFRDYINNAIKTFKNLGETNKITEEVMSRNISYLEKLRILGEMGDKKVAQTGKEREAEDKKTIERKLKLATDLMAQADELANKSKINLNDKDKDITKQVEDLTSKLNKIQSDARLANRLALMSDLDKEIELVTLKYEEQLNLLKKYGRNTVDLERQIEREKQDVRDEFYKKEAQVFFDTAQKKEQEAKDNAKKINDEQLKALQEGLDGVLVFENEVAKPQRKTFNDLTIEEQKQVNAERYQLTQNSLSLIGGLNELFASTSDAGAKKAFEFQKGIAIAQTIISGIEGTQNAYTTAQKSPFTALFPGYPLVQAGLAASFAAIKVGMIEKTRFNSRSTSNATAGGGAAAPQAQFNIVGQGPANRLAETVANREQQPLRAYVVGSDVTSQQSLDRNKINNSTFL